MAEKHKATLLLDENQIVEMTNDYAIKKGWVKQEESYLLNTSISINKLTDKVTIILKISEII